MLDDDGVGAASWRAAPAEAIPLLHLGAVLLCALPAELTDAGVRSLRDRVGLALREREVRALLLDASCVDTMDSYLTRCVRDLALAARCMGTPTVLCGLRPDVASTLVDMGLGLDAVHTASDLTRALALVGDATARRERKT